jgi:hypothetical protein
MNTARAIMPDATMVGSILLPSQLFAEMGEPKTNQEKQNACKQVKNIHGKPPRFASGYS